MSLSCYSKILSIVSEWLDISLFRRLPIDTVSCLKIIFYYFLYFIITNKFTVVF
jgi:hypothetical protein